MDPCRRWRTSAATREKFPARVPADLEPPLRQLMSFLASSESREMARASMRERERTDSLRP